jgi:hypothetical protein
MNPYKLLLTILAMKDDIIDRDWNSYIKTIEEISDNTKTYSSDYGSADGSFE